MANHHLPLRSAADSIFDDLCLFDGPDLFKKLYQFFGSEPSGKLLDKNGSLVTLILRELCFRGFAFATFLGTGRATPVAIACFSIPILSVLLIVFGPPTRAVVAIVFRRSRTLSIVVVVSS